MLWIILSEPNISSGIQCWASRLFGIFWTVEVNEKHTGHQWRHCWETNFKLFLADLIVLKLWIQVFIVFQCVSDLTNTGRLPEEQHTSWHGGGLVEASLMAFCGSFINIVWHSWVSYSRMPYELRDTAALFYSMITYFKVEINPLRIVVKHLILWWRID